MQSKLNSKSRGLEVSSRSATSQQGDLERVTPLFSVSCSAKSVTLSDLSLSI